MQPSARQPINTLLDRSGIFISTLCLIHCLALPLLGAALPLLSIFSDNEMVHRVLVLFSIPIIILSILQHSGKKRSWLYPVFVSFGPFLLIGALIIPFMEEHEVLLTTIGAVLLSSAHLMNLLAGHRSR